MYRDLGTCKNLYRDERSEAPQGVGSSVPVSLATLLGVGSRGGIYQSFMTFEHIPLTYLYAANLGLSTHCLFIPVDYCPGRFLSLDMLSIQSSF